MRRDEPFPSDFPPADRPCDRWMCGQPAGSRPCSRGPSPRGRCPLADACKPVATWSGQRKRMVTCALAMAGIVLLLGMQKWFAPTVLKPGELSTPHAQILSDTLTTARCAACHPGAAKPSDFFSAEIAGHASVSQSDRCLDCHHATIARERAMQAHNLNQHALEGLRVASTAVAGDTSWHDLLPGPANDASVECSVCHREHQGAGADMLAVSDTQCQTCHHDRFGSFAGSHPDWDRWPYGRGGDLSFDHRSHATKHFPAARELKGETLFRCADCHLRTADNELVRTVGYEIGCRSCHDQSLQIESAQGIELLAMPILDGEAARRAKPWPERATGFYDGRVAPLAALLLRAEPKSAHALRELTDHDFALIDASDTPAAEAGYQVAVAHRDLLLEVGSAGQNVIAKRLSAAGIAPSTARDFLRSLPPQLLADAYRAWFVSGRQSDHQASHPASTSALWAEHRAATAVEPGPASERLSVAAHIDDPLLDDTRPDVLSPDADIDADSLLGDADSLLGDADSLLGDDGGVDGRDFDDPLAIRNASSQKPAQDEQFDASVMLPNGGWYRDDLQFAIRYRGGGHADPVIRSTIEIASQLSPADPLRQRLLGSRAVSACLSCHVAAINSTGRWRGENLVGRPTDFTKFSHGPHLNVAALANCRQCHQINKFEAEGVAATALSPHAATEFVPLSRESCASCHSASAAGDACVKCHRYHVGGRRNGPALTGVTVDWAHPL